jgi:small subunit ribosomal protein S9
MEIYNSVGRRKTSVARVYLRPGKGKIQINDKDFDKYFPTEVLRTIVKEPLKTLGSESSYNIKINVGGGGFRGQAEAIRLGIARALVVISEDNRLPLKKEGLLTRDPRMVERKKYGRRKARRKFQFSKR